MSIVQQEPWQGPTELSLSRALTLAAEDWIGPSKDSSYKTQTHPPSDEVKLMVKKNTLINMFIAKFNGLTNKFLFSADIFKWKPKSSQQSSTSEAYSST